MISSSAEECEYHDVTKVTFVFQIDISELSHTIFMLFVTHVAVKGLSARFDFPHSVAASLFVMNDASLQFHPLPQLPAPPLKDV